MSIRIWFSGIKFADYGKAGRLRDERNDQEKEMNSWPKQ
jgi:hypothetical protein